MTSNRRARIEAMLEDDPGDVFLRYSLALELAAEGETDRGIAILADLAAEKPPYVPAFHMAGRHLAAHGRHDEARRFLRDGIEEARRQGQEHAAGEMAGLLMELGSAGEG
ncbi:MAG: tetratricopeptide repeat protein [Pirellulales bacterium]|jgi:predicted Zn-dependent protease